jgi:peroxin-12
VCRSALSAFLWPQVLEWWFERGEEELEAASRAVPPPPPPYAPHPRGVPLPADRGACPLCRRRRVAPAVLAVSGYAFCYKCLFQHVNAAGCCPVTRIRATADDIRRLFLSS